MTMVIVEWSDQDGTGFTLREPDAPVDPRFRNAAAQMLKSEIQQVPDRIRTTAGHPLWTMRHLRIRGDGFWCFAVQGRRDGIGGASTCRFGFVPDRMRADRAWRAGIREVAGAPATPAPPRPASEVIQSVRQVLTAVLAEQPTIVVKETPAEAAVVIGAVLNCLPYQVARAWTWTTCLMNRLAPGRHTVTGTWPADFAAESPDQARQVATFLAQTGQRPPGLDRAKVLPERYQALALLATDAVTAATAATMTYAGVVASAGSLLDLLDAIAPRFQQRATPDFTAPPEPTAEPQPENPPGHPRFALLLGGLVTLSICGAAVVGTFAQQSPPADPPATSTPRPQSPRDAAPRPAPFILEPGTATEFVLAPVGVLPRLDTTDSDLATVQQRLAGSSRSFPVAAVILTEFATDPAKADAWQRARALQTALRLSVPALADTSVVVLGRPAGGWDEAGSLRVTFVYRRS